MNPADATALVVAAAQAAGPCPEGEEEPWKARVQRLAVDLAFAARAAGEDLARIDAAAKFTALLEKVEIQPETGRGVLTLRTSEGQAETISTEQETTVRGAAMIAQARALTHRWVLVHRANETFKGPAGHGTMRTVVHLTDLGEGVLSKQAAWRVLLADAQHNQADARRAWQQAGLPDDGPVRVDRLDQARQSLAGAKPPEV
ncbi:hypothetical protein AB8B12_00540 [Streptomyces sp. PGLac3x]